jgi:hypothetical protein
LIERGEYLRYATEMSVVGDQLINIATAIHEHASQMSNKEIAKHITEFATEWVLTGQMFAMGQALCSNLGNIIKGTIKFLKDEGAAGEFAIATTDGILLKASENIQKGDRGVSDIVRSARAILEAVHAEYMAVLEAEIELLRLVFDNRPLLKL